ncbi:MAG: thiol-disulfide oxidoreductase DCC family protein [Flavobacteriaceae bacterium]
MIENKKIILFDGVCNLCNSAVQYVIEHDKNNIYRFAALQSDIGGELMKERGMDASQIDSIILIEQGVAYYTKSTAALKIARSFGGIWQLVVVFQWIPEKIRDRVYDYIAHNRYKWYGKKNACMVPTQELKSKFL